jgi:hypothetical protein
MANSLPGSASNTNAAEILLKEIGAKWGKFFEYGKQSFGLGDRAKRPHRSAL